MGSVRHQKELLEGLWKLRRTLLSFCNPKRADSARGTSSDIRFWADFGVQEGQEKKPRQGLGRAVEVICAIVDFERPYHHFERFWAVQGQEKGSL